MLRDSPRLISTPPNGTWCIIFLKHRATETKCDNHHICGYPTTCIEKANSRQYSHMWGGCHAFLSLSTQMSQIRQLLSYTYFPIKYSKPFNHVHSRALNNPLTLTGSMSSQTRQHLPLYQSNVELKSTLYFTMFCFGFS